MTEKDRIKRGERLLDTVHDLIGEEMNVIDTDISYAIRQVGKAMSPKGEDYLSAGVELAEYLISERPICRGTRLMLAELVLGELRNPKVRAKKIGAGHPKVVEAVSHYDKRISEGWPPKAAEHDVFKSLGVKRSTLYNYIKLVREREEQVAKAKAVIGCPK
ncbi:hypothetical protein [Antarcticimicrobium luteum]|uniref:Uncharacterized protein n=1 Tax=Antarcticimicrobium luteum TaxID=2547397 RepID=A0A4R5VBN4_9RHOB|nr:hypothetical protein [Antarcticimicrobium luteum]TDK49642.1 hypothetical protein E1832_08580 [Antarcticimicrobium luteum]